MCFSAPALAIIRSTKQALEAGSEAVYEALEAFYAVKAKARRFRGDLAVNRCPVSCRVILERRF